MNAADTSLLVAAFASWHPGHRAAVEVVAHGAVMPVEHALLETYSVLTRLPPPHRITPTTAALWIERQLGPDVLRPRAASVATLPRLVATLDISGGATYDALVGITARDAGMTLLTRDRRAIRTYDLLDVPFTLVD